MAPHHVLIAGAGIAGPALALVLSRRGWRVTVVERAPALRQGGQAVDVRGPAREVLARMGVLPAVVAAHTGVSSFAFVDDDGAVAAEMRREVFGDAGVVAALEILRGDLVRVFVDACGAGVEFVFGDEVAALADDGAGVDVAFAGGGNGRYDVVVGADGLRSRVRTLVFGDGGVDDLGCSAAGFTARADVDLGTQTVMWSVARPGGGGSVGLYPTGTPGQVKALFVWRGDADVDGRASPAAQAASLRRGFAGARWPVVGQLLAQLDDAGAGDDVYFDRVAQVVLPRWRRGRVILLGDAACCASPLGGNGTSTAVVGAWVLGHALADACASAGGAAAAIDVAAAAYERVVRPLADRGQAFARQGASTLLPSSRAALWLRNASIRMLPWVPWRGLVLKAMANAPDAVELPG